MLLPKNRRIRCNLYVAQYQWTSQGSQGSQAAALFKTDKVTNGIRGAEEGDRYEKTKT